MKIKLAQPAGYCLGVKKAMDAAFGLLYKPGQKVYSHGELIHNGPALELLAQKGLNLWEGQTDGTVIIRAHGLPPEQLKSLSHISKIKDATCPRVRRVQKLIAKEAEAGRLIIIWGKSGHPEVIGLEGYANGQAHVLSTPLEVANLPAAETVLLVAQTTQDLSLWPAMVEAVKNRWPEALVINTICEATVERQTALRKLAKEVEALVVIGGKNSSNTARLADIGRQENVEHVILVETAEELANYDLKNLQTVGIAAGASTSSWQIAQVLQALRAQGRSRSGFSDFGPRLLRAFVLSGLLLALGMGGLSLMASKLLGQTLNPLLFSFFTLQTLALYLFRRLSQHRSRSQSQALKIADPDRRAFLTKYDKALKFLLFFSALHALIAAWQLLGVFTLTLTLATWLAMLLYQFLPRPKKIHSPITPLLTGPMLTALGGALYISLTFCPLLKDNGDFGAIIFTFGAIFGHLLAIITMNDVLGMQEDRLFGRPTLSTIFGEKLSRRFLIAFLVSWAGGLALGAGTGTLPPFAWLLIASGPLYTFALPFFPTTNDAPPKQEFYGFSFETLLIGQLWLSGILAIFF